jgi:hypothetical protein
MLHSTPDTHTHSRRLYPVVQKDFAHLVRHKM